MSFSILYRISFYAMLVFAALVLSVDSPDSKIAMIYPAFVFLASVVAFLTVDRRPRGAVSDLMLSMLSIGSVALWLVEFALDPTLLLLSLGHWLIYLQLILMFRPKSVREDWEMFLLGLVEVMVGSVINQSDSVGMVLFGWAILALWVLGLFSLQRDAIRSQENPGAEAAANVLGVELYPGLLNLPFLFSALRVTLTTLALGGVIFLAMPRRVTMARTRAGEAVTQHLTGFDDEVQLGQLGEILENDNVVMSIEMVDDDGKTIVPKGEPLWRGVTMAIYENGRWFRQWKKPGTFPIIPPAMATRRAPGRPSGLIHQRIKLEANDSSALFGLRPMLDASAPAPDANASRRLPPELNAPELSAIDGTISRDEARTGMFDYEVISFRDDELPQPGESAPSAYRKSLLGPLGVPEAMRPRLKAIAEEVITKNLPPDRRDDQKAKARALESYLRDSGKFGYTLKLEVVDRKLDPVEDFLVNRKEGHCEYFASALTLLLRSAGIPARMVNGFKGGDWNDLAQVMNVRQKHAHSWVEAYLGNSPGAERSPIWLTLDPTPGAGRDASVAKVGGFTGNFRQITDAIRYIWVFYIVGYNAERQNALLYTPIRALAREARRGFSMMAQEFTKLKERGLSLLHFPNVESFISFRGLGVSLVAGLLLLGIGKAVGWLVRRLLRLIRGQDERSLALSIGAAQYRRLALLLQNYGLERPPAETQDEFARRATDYLTARGSNTEAVADVPGLVVDAFYRVRFGHLDLHPDVLLNLESRLDALEASLTASQD
jgi:protein-glutamine gamma-glutamyltransferase